MNQLSLLSKIYDKGFVQVISSIFKENIIKSSHLGDINKMRE